MDFDIEDKKKYFDIEDKKKYFDIVYIVYVRLN